MTQEFVTLPREAVERALAALWNTENCESCFRKRVSGSMKELRAALEQPQPRREPLTDKQIDAIAESMPGGLDGFLKGWGWRQFARAVLEAAPQPPTVKECLTDELKPRFSAHDDAERLKSVARGMSYNDHGEAVWKHTLMEIAVRLESGGYAAPQPQDDQEPVRKMYVCNSCQFPYADQPPSQCDCLGDETYTEAYLCTNLQPKREPLTDEQIKDIVRDVTWEGSIQREYRIVRATERAHNIK